MLVEVPLGPTQALLARPSSKAEAKALVTLDKLQSSSFHLMPSLELSVQRSSHTKPQK